MSTAGRSRASRLHYGWRVVAGAFVTLAFSSGLGFYSQSVLLEALTVERGFSVAAASLATALFFAVSGLVGLPVAQLVDRFDVRWTVIAGALISALAWVLIGRVAATWQLYAAFALFGVGFAAGGMVPGTTVVTRWFATRRALALAVASTGLSIGGIVLTPLAARSIAAHGLAGATPRVAIMLLIGVVPISLWLLRDRPEGLGLEPHGGGAAEDRSATTAPTLDFSDAVRSRYFVAVTAAFVFGLLAQVAGISHQFKHISVLAGSGTAQAAVSVLAACSVIGRFAIGGATTVVPLRPLAIGLVLAQGATLVTLGRSSTPATLLLASAAFGLTVGSFLLMQPLLISEAFGIRHYARLFSISSMVTTVGVAAGPALLGMLHDSLGGYSPAFAFAGATSVLTALCLLLAGASPVARRIAVPTPPNR